MKNNKILMKSSFIILIILATSVFFNKVFAADLAVSANGSKVTISSQYTGKVNISVSGGSASESSVWLEGNSQVITISNVAESGATVTVTPAKIKDSNGNYVTGLSDSNGAIVSVSAKSVKIAGTKTTTDKTTDSNKTNTTKTDTTKSETTKTDTAKEPTFKATNETVYATGNINVRKSYSADSDKLGSLQTGESITRTGIGDNGWSKVTFNGGTGYIKTSLLSTEEPKKSDDKTLKSLEIANVQIDPAFDPEITEYSVIVGTDVEKLDIKATPNSDKATTEITGNEAFKEGDNLIKITVTAEDKTARIYTINVTKQSEGSLTLSTLKIEGYTLNPKFSPDVYEYKLTILDPNVTNLNVNAVTNVENATVETTGNTDLKQGENIIKVVVKSEDGSETATYKITVNKNAAAATTSSQNDWILYAGITVIAILIIAIIAIIIISKRKNAMADEEYENGDYSDLYGYSSKNIKSSENDNKYNDEYNNFEEKQNDKKYLEEELFGKIPERIDETEEKKEKYEDSFSYNQYNTTSVYENDNSGVDNKVDNSYLNTNDNANNYMQVSDNKYEDYMSSSYSNSKLNEEYESNEINYDYNDDTRQRRTKGKHAK